MEGSVAWSFRFSVAVIAILVWFALKILNWVWFEPKKMENFVRKQGLKGTSYKFLFGDVKEMARMVNEAKSRPINITDDIVPRVQPFHHKYFTAYGTNFFTWMGPRLMVQIVEPALLKEVLAHNYLFQRPRGRNPLIKLLVTGLPDADADEWAKHRKIINPAFHVEKLKHMVPAIYACCSEIINKWEEMLKNESSCEVDVRTYLQKFTGDVISRTAFGSSFQEGNKVFELQQELAKLVQELLQSAYIPGSRFLPTKRNRRIKKIDREVTTLIRSIIDKRIIAMKAGESSNDDLLGILLESNYTEIKQQGDNKFGLTIEEVIQECKVFYLAGQETTGNLLVWTMILLAHHKNWQALAREEVLQVFGEKQPDVSGLNHLKTVSMIFNEVLRLYPPVSDLGRMIHQDTKLGDITLPAGSYLRLNVLLLHHDRDLWGDDVTDFNPQRFSEGVSKATKGQASYIPFGGGPRICIGQNFALLEAKFALAMILQHFYFDLSPSYSHAPESVLTLQPEYGAHLLLRKIKG